MHADPKTPVQTCLILSINEHRFSDFLIYSDRYFTYGKIYPLTADGFCNFDTIETLILLVLSELVECHFGPYACTIKLEAQIDKGRGKC